MAELASNVGLPLPEIEDMGGAVTCVFAMAYPRLSRPAAARLPPSGGNGSSLYWTKPRRA